MIALMIAYILNIVDYVFTAFWVNKFGVEIESNPMGRWMFENNIAWAVKIFVMGGVFGVLFVIIRVSPKAVVAAYILLAVFSAIVLYHTVVAICVAAI